MVVTIMSISPVKMPIHNYRIITLILLVLVLIYKLSCIYTHTHTEGEDYTTAGTNVDLTVSAGDTHSCFSVTLLNDNIYKTDKSFYYRLGSHDHHVTIEGAPSGEVRIADNDEEAVIIGFEHDEYTVVESESVTACVWMTGAQIGQPFTATIYTAHTSTINRGQLHVTGSFGSCKYTSGVLKLYLVYMQYLPLINHTPIVCKN